MAVIVHGRIGRAIICLAGESLGRQFGREVGFNVPRPARPPVTRIGAGTIWQFAVVVPGVKFQRLADSRQVALALDPERPFFKAVHSDEGYKSEHAEHTKDGGDIQRPDGPGQVPVFGETTSHDRSFI